MSVKKKKQTRKIKQWLAAALGLTLLGTGLWAGMNGEKLQAKPKSDINFSPKGVEDTEPWLPNYKPNQEGGWLDSEKNVIPKENAFVIQDMDDTEIEDMSQGIKDEEGALGVYERVEQLGTLAIPVDKGTQWIKFKNTGYYNGRKVSVKMSVTPQVDSNVSPAPLDQFKSYIGVSGFNFLLLGLTREAHDAYVRYDFYDEEGQPLAISSYWSIGNYGRPYRSVSIPKDYIKNIYSVNRQLNIENGDHPIMLKYDSSEQELDGNMRECLDIWGQDIPNNWEEYRDFQREATITFEDKNYFEFNFHFEPSYLERISYTGQSVAKVEIPDPQDGGIRYFRELIQKPGNPVQGIVNNEIENLDYNFIQQIPWESVKLLDNRNQKIKWAIKQPIGGQVLKSITDSNNGWEIWAKDENEERTSWFDFKNLTEIKPSTTVDYSSPTSPFYNHYYNFIHQLTIDYNKQVDVSTLKEAEFNGVNKKAILELGSGSAKLEVTDDNPPGINDPEVLIPGKASYGGEVPFQTSINFYAPLEYKYVNSVTGDEIPAGSLPESAKPTGDGFVTWDAPLTPMSFDEYEENGEIPTEKTSAPTIAGYTFKTATFNGDSVSSENFAQIKVTKLLKDGGDATKAEDYTQNNVVTLEYQPLYTVEVQVGALDTDGNFGTIPFAPPSGVSAPYVTVQETTAPTTPENAISPTGTEPAAEFTFPTTYDFEVGTGKSYKVTQMENVNNDYTKPNQATSPVFLINDQNQLVVDGQVVSNSTYQGEDFILSWDATNKKLTIQIINQPNGEYQLVSVEPLKYGKVSLPQKNPDELIKRQDADWKVQFTDTRLEAYRTPLKLSVRLDQNFTNTNDPTKTISGILLYRSEATTPITPDAFLIEGEEIPIKEKINPDSDTNDIDWPEQAGFLLQIDAEKQTKIFAGDYQAELTFILSEDPL